MADFENNSMSNFEKIQFLQYEYEWQKKRKSDVVDKAQMLLVWNAGIFTFAVMFTDIEKIINSLTKSSITNITILIIVLIILGIISLVVLIISSLGFFNCIKLSKQKCFSTENYIDNGFNTEDIIKDYREIILDYDESIKELYIKIERNTILMIISIAMILSVEFFLRILVNI